VNRVEEIKTELQCLGVRRKGNSAADPVVRLRTGGAGPAEGITLLLNGSPASVPFASDFVSDSPYGLVRDNDCWALVRGGERLRIRVVPLAEASFYRSRTEDGVAFEKIALLHGADCLASTVLQSCSYWGTPLGCRFCGIGLSWKAGKTVLKKRPRDLASVAMAAREQGVRHVTLTAGATEGRGLEWGLCLEASRAIAEASGLPVHVQLMPPVPRGRLDKLRAAGVQSIGIHLETWDPDLLRRVAPCKARLPRRMYLDSWLAAVEVFGRGQVESFLLMGLGESEQSLLDGCGELASLGVYPYLVPFRPIPGTSLATRKPPNPETAKGIYRRAARILEGAGLDWAASRAGCVRCRGCSALPDYQDALARGRSRPVVPDRLAWEVVRAGPFAEASFAIRHEIFVEEQGFFEHTDLDGLDADSFHIVVRQGSRCLGTVRITPLGGDLWLGSRLGVRQGYRGSLGARLVEKAEAEVLRRGGKRFTAYIQKPRVGFFRGCGWRALEEIADYHGRPHTLMAAAGPLWTERHDRAAGSLPRSGLTVRGVLPPESFRP